MQRFKSVGLDKIFILTLFVIVGCGPIIPITKSTRSIFVLNDFHENKCEKVNGSSVSLSTESGNYLEGTQIVFSSSEQERGFYQFAEWVEPLGKRLIFLLSERLRCSTEKAEQSIEVQILDFRHVTTTPPGEFQVVLRIRVLGDSGEAKAMKDFVKTEKVNSFDAKGATSAASFATTAAIDEIVEWLNEYKA